MGRRRRTLRAGGLVLVPAVVALAVAGCGGSGPGSSASSGSSAPGSASSSATSTRSVDKPGAHATAPRSNKGRSPATTRIGGQSSPAAARVKPGSPAGAGVHASSVATGPAAKRFRIHAELAFGIFHHEIYGPFAAGKLAHTRNDKLARASAASAAAYDELAKAKQAVGSDRMLLPLFGPLAALGAMLTGVTDELHNGRAVPSTIDSTNAAIKGIEQTAAFSGIDLIDRVPATSPRCPRCS